MKILAIADRPPRKGLKEYVEREKVDLIVRKWGQPPFMLRQTNAKNKQGRCRRRNISRTQSIQDQSENF